MNSWILEGERKITAVNEPDEVIPAGHAKVKIIRAGIDNKDLYNYGRKNRTIYDYASKIIPCSSAVGLISECPTHEYKSGQRVLLSSLPKMKGETCYDKGYLREYATVPFNNIYDVPDSIEDNALVFIDTIATACNLMERLALQKTQVALLSGVSVTNVILAQLVRYHQALPIIIDKSEERLAFAQEFGIDMVIDSSSENVEYMVKSFTSGKMASALIIDADISENIDASTRCLSRGGKIALMNTNSDTKYHKFDLINILEKELTIFGVKNGIGKVSMAINLLATGKVKVSDLIKETVGFADAPDTIGKLYDAQASILKKTIIKCNS